MSQICELVYSFKIIPFFYVIDLVSQKQISIHFIPVFYVVSGITVVQLNEYSHSWCIAGFPKCYVTMYHFHFSNNFNVPVHSGEMARGPGGCTPSWKGDSERTDSNNSVQYLNGVF